MAFERLERPVAPVIQPPVEVCVTRDNPAHAWPAGSPCACLRKRADGSLCGHQWKTRMAGKPNACPKCKQSRWDVAPKQSKRRAK